MKNPNAIASHFDFDLTKTWSELSKNERANVTRAMSVIGIKSINGASGYFSNLRDKYLKEKNK